MRRAFRHLTPSLVACLLLAAAASSGAAGSLGIAVGDPAPKFLLEDATGTPRSLDSLLERGKLAIVFYRSADW